MNIKLFVCVAQAIGLVGGSVRAGPPAFVSERGKLLFSADFSGETIPEEWVGLHHTRWSIEDGALKGIPSPAEYQASRKGKGHTGATPSSRIMVKVDDAVLQMRFKLSREMSGAHVGFNDGSFKTGTGHVCRAVLDRRNQKLILIKDDNAKIDDDEDEELAEAPCALKLDKWHTLNLRIKGPTMAVQIDDGPVLEASHPRIDIVKDQINLPTRGGGTIFYDDVKIWSLKKN